MSLVTDIKSEKRGKPNYGSRSEQQDTSDDETSSAEETSSRDGSCSPEELPLPDREWIIEQFQQRYCDESTGRVIKLPNFSHLARELKLERPGDDSIVSITVKR
jgi:hypothetical protein